MARVYKAVWKEVEPGKWRWRDVADNQSGVFFIDYRDVSGRRVRKQVKAKTRTLANELLTAAEDLNNKARIMGAESVQAVTPVLFSDFVEETFLKNCATKSPNTLQGYKDDFAATKDHFAGLTLRSVTPGHIESFMTKRRADGFAATTVNHNRRFLCAVFSMAKRYKLVTDNPVEVVKPLGGENEGRDFDFKEQARIFEHLEAWVKPIVTFALHTGMRLSEIAGLEWTRVKLDDGYIGLGKHKTKGKYARPVPINSVVREILEARKPEKLGPALFVFTNPDKKAKGKHYSASGISHAFKRAVIEAGLPAEGPDRIVFHSTRHCFVSRMVRDGKRVGYIKKIVGHKSDRLVSKYTHMNDADLIGSTEGLVSSGSGNGMAMAAGGK